MRRAATVAMLLALSVGSAAAEFEARSGPAKVSLLELYTSEGCSSCPAADEWLGGLREDPRLWHEVVPVAFHVDYWDSLGWPDRFADADHTRRQRAHAENLGMRTIYTPGLFLDGAEWRRWYGMRDLELQGGDGAGELHAWREGDRVQVRYRPSGSRTTQLQAHVVLLGFGLRSDVSAGENSGRDLRHDFVVLQHRTETLRSADEGLSASTTLTVPGEAGDRQAIAVWVSERSAPAPLQAAGGWLH